MDKKIFLSLCFLLITATAIADDYIFFPTNGHYYKWFDENLTWQEAQQYCAKLGGYLVTITSSEEHHFVYDNLGLEANRRGKVVFLGGTDEKEEGRWEWITGENNSYMPICPGEPNGGRNENILVFWPGYTGMYCFDDYRNYADDRSPSFICEWDFNPAEANSSYQAGFEAGKQYCIENPSACGIIDRYEEGIEEGKELCREDPLACGIDLECENNDNSMCEASFNLFTNTLHIPCLRMGESYWLDLILISSDPVQLQLSDFGKNE